MTNIMIVINEIHTLIPPDIKPTSTDQEINVPHQSPKTTKFKINWNIWKRLFLTNKGRIDDIKTTIKPIIVFARKSNVLKKDVSFTFLAAYCRPALMFQIIALEE